MNKKIVDAFRHRGYRIPDGATVPLGIKKTDTNILLGEVKYVDSERQTFTADIFYRDTTLQDVAVAQPFAGPSSFISGMPEKGSVVLIGVMENFSFLIGYLPTYIYACNYQHVKKWPDSVQSKENHLYYRHRKLRSGEINASSAEGAELFLSYDASLESPGGDSIVIRNSDHSIIQTSLSSFIFNSGVWSGSGIAQRPGLDEGDIEDGGFARRRMLRDGRITYELKADDDNALSRFYTEYLIEAQELSTPQLPSNSVNESFDMDIRRPVGVFSMGNFIGNDPNKPRTYGKLLGVSLFNSPDDREGGFEWKALTKDEPERFGMAAMLYAPKKTNYEYGALFGIDKEGHFYQFIPSASGGGIGGGRSMSILAKGSKKEVWGSDSRGLSWDLNLKGGLDWHVGLIQSNNDYDTAGRSIRIVADGPAYFQYGSAKPQIADFDNPDQNVRSLTSYKKVEKIGGKERRELTGTSEEIIGGSQKIRVSGMKIENISGSAARYIGGDYNVQVATSYSLKVSGEGQEGFKEKNITCTGGGHSLTVFTKGDIAETINVRGNRKFRTTSGDVTETIVTRGSRKFRAATGNYEVRILTQGNVKHQTTAGSIVSKTKAGKAEIDATLQVKVKTKAAMDLRGTKIRIKTATPSSGVITKLSHLDYITGAPLQNSKTVSISM